MIYGACRKNRFASGTFFIHIQARAGTEETKHEPESATTFGAVEYWNRRY